jgi:hypothetical protein
LRAIFPGRPNPGQYEEVDEGYSVGIITFTESANDHIILMSALGNDTDLDLILTDSMIPSVISVFDWMARS